MNDFAILWDDFEETSWAVVQNSIEEIETSPSRHPEDPDTWVIGYAGDTVLGKHLLDANDEPVHLLLQVQWTAIDAAAQYRRNYRGFDPELKILQAVLLSPDEPVFILDNPDDQLDPDYTWQDVFADDPTAAANEALDDIDDQQLFSEVK
ncbi:hypothetical protein LCGC14_0469000 [marine sediment metagenome]|uniref:Uncharacterized protein n=1 Tax=marine sediment metagenome TaxID=412755 RepID=A0A0F9SI36_9ZZZZ